MAFLYSASAVAVSPFLSAIMASSLWPEAAESCSRWGSRAFGFVEAAADGAGGEDVEGAEVEERVEVVGAQAGGLFEGRTDAAGQGEGGDQIGAGGLLAVGAAEPELVVAVVGSDGDGGLALVDGLIEEILRVVDAAEELMGGGVSAGRRRGWCGAGRRPRRRVLPGWLRLPGRCRRGDRAADSGTSRQREEAERRRRSTCLGERK